MKNEYVDLLFTLISNVVTIVEASCKRHDMLKGIQATNVLKALESGEFLSGKGLNQDTSLKRVDDTHWGHYNTLISLISMFSSVIDVLDFVAKDRENSKQRIEAHRLLDSLQSFSFSFSIHLMRNIMRITNELSQALKRKDQDIVIAVNLVRISKQRLQLMRDNGWESLLNKDSSFSSKHNIDIPNMDDVFVVSDRPRRNIEKTTNIHHYRVEVFYHVIDLQIQELNNRFNKVNSELLLCVACLNPIDSFSSFNKENFLYLAQFYPGDFFTVQLVALDNQLKTYILDMRSDNQFLEVKGMSNLAEKMVNANLKGTSVTISL